MQTLRDRVTLLCEQATEAIRRSLTALLEDDEALAREVGANDAQINVAQFDIEEYAYSLLSERKLAVSEVRRIVGMIVLTRVLEQVGDHAANIAHFAVSMKRLEARVDMSSVFSLIAEMASTATEITQQACNALLQQDARRAEAAVRRDQELMDTFDAINAVLIQPPEQSRIPPEHGQLLLRVAYNLRQIGMCAVIVCERAIFLATGELKDFH